MTYWDRKTAREQLDAKLKALEEYSASGTPKQGLIKAIREALGMSAAQLGKRTGIDQSRVSRLENAEATGQLKLSSLQKIAKGLNMRFVYGFVPETSLEAMVRGRAERIAAARLKALDHTMSLEKQELTGAERLKAMEDMIEKTIIEQPKDFWD